MDVQNTEANDEPKSVKIEFDRLLLIAEQEGYRYYEDPVTKAQFSVDSANYWFLFNVELGYFEPVTPITTDAVDQQAPAIASDNKNSKPSQSQLTPAESNKQPKSGGKQAKSSKKHLSCGIPFDDDGHPIYPVNKDGLPILPKDDGGQPFFPTDDFKRPIFPWDPNKNTYTFPVDDTDEPIFPRNDQNKPIVPQDDNGQPIFPVDRYGEYIFPLDESHCPIPALTVEGNSVVPRDEYGEFVIPKDREGKELIHVVTNPDGTTALSMADWKQWKKYYKEHSKMFYQHQQQQNQTATSGGSYHSIFHPLNLEQHNAYLSQDIEMLARVRRVRPEDIDLPTNVTNMELNGRDGQQSGTPDANILRHNDASWPAKSQELEQQAKRKKLLIEQLKFAKKAGAINTAKKEQSAARIPDTKKTEERERESHNKESKKEKKRSEKKKKHRNRSRSSSRSSRSSSSSPKRKRSRKNESSKKKRSSRRRRSPSDESSRSSSPSSEASTNTFSSRDDSLRSRSRSRTRTRTRSSSNRDSEKSSTKDMEYGPVPPTEKERTDRINGGGGGGNSDMSMSDATPPPQPPQQREEYRAKGKNERNEKFEQLKKGDGVISSAAKEVIKIEPKKREFKSPINIDEAAKSDDLELIRFCIEQTREKYNNLKVQIAELEVQRSVHKRNLAVLRDAEKRIEYRRGVEYLSSSDASP